MKTCLGCFIILTVLSVIASIAFIAYEYKGCTTTIDKVISKESLPYDTVTKYRIIGNNDSYDLDSSGILGTKDIDLYPTIDVNTTYKFKTCGLRIPLINYYKIIVNAQPL